MKLKSYFCSKLLIMKKFFGLLALLFLINSCDDGDVAVQDISFENATGAICTNLAYKIKGNEVLIINFADIKKAFIDDQTIANKPISLNIADGNSVTYRAYNDVPTASNFCGALPPASPIVVEEWTATGGTIEITSTISKTTSTATTGNTNQETIDGYNQLIILRNVTFKKPNGDQFYEEFRFGTIKPDFTRLNFEIFKQQTIEKCETNNNLTSKNGITSLISFDNSSGIIQNSATIVGSPRVATISPTNNLYYRVFDNLNFITYKCATSYLTTDSTLKQEWNATSGTVEVTTESSATNFIHKVRLKGVKFKKGNTEFYLGDDFELGEFETP
jgi:hypothetical protein